VASSVLSQVIAGRLRAVSDSSPTLPIFSQIQALRESETASLRQEQDELLLHAFR
jgi:hypothetical protein